MSVAGSAAEKVPRKNLNEDERRALIEELLKGSNRGKLAKGDMQRVAQMFGCSRYQVSAVWKRYTQQKDAGIVAIELRNNRKGNSGRKPMDLAATREKLLQIPPKNRTTQRAVAAQLGIPISTLNRNMEKLGLHASRRYLKLLLTENHKAARLL